MKRFTTSDKMILDHLKEIGYSTDTENSVARICKVLNELHEEKEKLREALQGYVDNVMDNKKIAQNQINYYRGVFRKLLKETEQA